MKNNEINEKPALSKMAVSGRFQIKVSEIKAINNRLRQINDNKISDIDFLDENGLLIKIEQKNIDDWIFSGLNISDFIDSDFYINGFCNENESS